MNRNMTGLKIRSLRKQAGLSQGELARRAGISPSYLNLIELNKRAVAGALLDRLAAGIGVERALLDGEAERRLAQSLEEIAADAAIGPAHPGPTEELVARHPGWAELVIRLHQAYRDQNQAVLALADRLNRDPFLGDSVHRMLTHVTSIRSAAEILDGGEGLGAGDRARFLAIVASDSRRLSETARGLASFFDSASMRVRSATPMEHVDAFVFETGNHFPALEEIAEAFLRSCGGEAPEAAAARQIGDGEAEAGWELAPETRRFALMKALSQRIAADAVQDLAAHEALPSEEARALAANALHAYAAGAMLMPYEPFLEAAERHRYDLDALSRRFGVSYEQAAHRLATLRRPDAEGVRFAFMRSDPSGYVTKRLPLPRLPLPRYGTACPLWVVYAAFQTPGVTARNFGELPSGDRFLFFARAVEKGRRGVGPRHLMSVMLACPAAEAHRTVYGDGIDRASATQPVGTVCRLCRREACAQRQEAPLIA